MSATTTDSAQASLNVAHRAPAASRSRGAGRAPLRSTEELRALAEAGLGRTVRGLKVPASGLTDYVERLVRRYLDQRLPEETFAQWAHRADEEALQ